MKKIAVIFGTRPEAIKLAPVILALKRDLHVLCRVCVTAQHRTMLDQVLEIFDIVPDVDLDLMRPNQTLGGLTSRAIKALDQYLGEDKPDVVLVQGDTTTVLCAALAALYHKIPVGHIEAGLRTGNMASPWPEEANRVLTTRLANWHFAPTETNRQNLLREGVSDTQIHVTGNTVIDALFHALKKIHALPPPIPGLPGETLSFLGGRKMVLITGHRRENFGEGLENICHAIVELAARHPDTDFIYPVHLNPHVREPVQRLLGGLGATRPLPNIYIIAPQAYLPFVALMDRACVILTDSGGVQEEAPSLGKPVLVMRDTTERPEGITAGTVRLVGANATTIRDETSLLLSSLAARNAMARPINPYGDGHASTRIVRLLLKADGVQGMRSLSMGSTV
jgi:UDP-N-acetylglucosamine 2-epimerase (non-hydrolysing)